MQLSKREQQIVDLLVAYSWSNKAIARHLVLAEGTVKVHLISVYRKLGINSRLALMRHHMMAKPQQTGVGNEIQN
jgi:DNA-binding NarL/FixJ family response regulator